MIGIGFNSILKDNVYLAGSIRYCCLIFYFRLTEGKEKEEGKKKLEENREDKQEGRVGVKEMGKKEKNMIPQNISY